MSGWYFKVNYVLLKFVILRYSCFFEKIKYYNFENLQERKLVMVRENFIFFIVVFILEVSIKILFYCQSEKDVMFYSEYEELSFISCSQIKKYLLSIQNVYVFFFVIFIVIQRGRGIVVFILWRIILRSGKLLLQLVCERVNILIQIFRCFFFNFIKFRKFIG